MAFGLIAKLLVKTPVTLTNTQLWRLHTPTVAHPCKAAVMVQFAELLTPTPLNILTPWEQAVSHTSSKELAICLLKQSIQ